MTVIKNQAFHWEKVEEGGGRCGSVLCPRAPPAHTHKEREEEMGGQLEAQARVIRGINRRRGEREMLRSPPNKRQRDKGQGDVVIL